MGITESVNIDEKYFGFRVYRINPKGPLAKAGIKELEDFIIRPNELNDKIPFYEFIRVNADKPIVLSIYSLAKREFFNVEITPNNKWGDTNDGYLGASVRFENWSTADSNLLRVINVKPGSNAEIMNLIPMEDYIIALRPDNKDIVTLNNDEYDPLTLFTKVLNENIGNSIEFYIYNCKTGSRTVRIKLEDRKNGELMGCDIAYGKLHTFPKLIQAAENKIDSIENLDEKKDVLDSNKGDTEPVIEIAIEEIKESVQPEIDENKTEDSKIVSESIIENVIVKDEEVIESINDGSNVEIKETNEQITENTVEENKESSIENQNKKN